MYKILRSYFWWTYERGSFHYDVMVTLILLFLFVGPHLINFHEKRPSDTVALSSADVMVHEDGTQNKSNRLIFQIQADDIHDATTEAERRTAILRVIKPISGDVKIDHYEPVRDAQGNITAYNVWILR